MIEYTIGIEGMHCGMCESHVNDSIRKVKGVKSVNASVSKQNAVVVIEDDADKEAIKNAVSSQGYKILSESEKPYEKKGLFKRLFGK